MTEKQTVQTDTLEQFADDIKNIATEHLDEKEHREKLSEFTLQLVLASIDESNDNQTISTDRRSRHTIRSVVPGALEYIKIESDGDQDLEKELTANLITALARLSITPETVPELLKEQPQKPTHEPHTEKEYVPTVANKDREFLESIVTEVEESGRWTNKTTEAAAKGYLTIYQPAQEKVRKNQGSHQEILNAIAACGTYSHAIAAALSNLSTLEQTARIDDMKAEIVKQLMLTADERTRRRLAMRDEYALASEPEIREFASAIKGAQYEVLAHDAIAEHRKALHIDEITYSSLEDDITHGFDISLKKSDTTYRLDVKAAKSFQHARKKYPKHSILADNTADGYLVRRTSHKDDDGNPINVIVIDAETTGAIKYHRNRLQLMTPKKYLETIDKSITVVDNFNK